VLTSAAFFFCPPRLRSHVAPGTPIYRHPSSAGTRNTAEGERRYYNSTQLARFAFLASLCALAFPVSCFALRFALPFAAHRHATLFGAKDTRSFAAQPGWAEPANPVAGAVPRAREESVYGRQSWPRARGSHTSQKTNSFISIKAPCARHDRLASLLGSVVLRFALVFCPKWRRAPGRAVDHRQSTWVDRLRRACAQGV
jgi:hypothetical protein